MFFTVLIDGGRWWREIEEEDREGRLGREIGRREIGKGDWEGRLRRKIGKEDEEGRLGGK